MYPEGQVQMALPLTGLVSQLEPSLQGLLMHASLRWHSRPRQDSRVEWALLFSSLGMTGGCSRATLTQYPEMNLCDLLKHRTMPGSLPVTCHQCASLSSKTRLVTAGGAKELLQLYLFLLLLLWVLFCFLF